MRIVQASHGAFMHHLLSIFEQAYRNKTPENEAARICGLCLLGGKAAGIRSLPAVTALAGAVDHANLSQREGVDYTASRMELTSVDGVTP